MSCALVINIILQRQALSLTTVFLNSLLNFLLSVQVGQIREEHLCHLPACSFVCHNVCFGASQLGTCVLWNTLANIVLNYILFRCWKVYQKTHLSITVRVHNTKLYNTNDFNSEKKSTFIILWSFQRTELQYIPRPSYVSNISNECYCHDKCWKDNSLQHRSQQL